MDACRSLADPGRPVALEMLAQNAGMSEVHFRRVFKKYIGITPMQYAATVRRNFFQGALMKSRNITTAMYDSGFRSASRVYEQADTLLGMTPSAYRRGGSRQSIRYATGACWLGRVLVALSGRGVCAILLGTEPRRLATALRSRFPCAHIEEDSSLTQVVSMVVNLIERPALGLALPLDIQGTVFQQRVWAALRKIQPGETRSYGQIAAMLGRPPAARAVAKACGANSLAVAVPCHRVVGGDGRLAGYRWGLARKKALLARERS